MDSQPFLRAIRAKPEDDLPRLIYADALEESGASERAEFIRVQVALANTAEHDPQFRVLEDREHELLGKHEETWIGRPDSWAQEWTWHRGFIDEVIFSEFRFARTCHRLRDEVVTRLEMTEQSGFRSPLKRDPDPIWDALRELTVHDLCNSERIGERLSSQKCKVTSLRGINIRRPSDFVQLSRFGEIRHHLKSLDVDFYNADMTETREATQDLIEIFDSGLLEHLHLQGCELDGRQLRNLLTSTATKSLKSLSVPYDPLGPDAVQAFVQCTAKLNRLNINGTPLAAFSLDRLLHTRSLQSLTQLNMDGTGSARTNLEVIAESSFWKTAERLSVRNGTVSASTFEPLTRAAGSAKLRHLELGNNYLRTEGVLFMCEAEWAKSLTFLSLYRNYLDDQSCEALVGSGQFAGLRTLLLSGNNANLPGSGNEMITDRGVFAICRSNMTSLRMLTLSGLAITDDAVMKIFDEAPFTLSSLTLEGTNVTPDLISFIAKHPKLKRLNHLDLSQNRQLAGNAFRPLAESEYLSPLGELDIRGTNYSPEMYPALYQRVGQRLTT